MADTRIEMVLEMLFLTLSNADMWFVEKKLVWKTYSVIETLPIIRKVEIINKKEFAVTVLNKKKETFIVHIVAFNIDSNIYTSRRAQTSLLDIEKVIISSKYIHYINVVSFDFATKLFKYISINNYFIDLIDDKQSPYGLIYSLELVKLETLKIYIKINLTNGFIRSSKLFANISILFTRKKNSSF